MKDVEVITYGEMDKAMQDAVDISILKACIDIVGEASETAPKDTGDLRQSIVYRTAMQFSTSKFGDIASKPKRGEGYVGSPLIYATYQEFGTRYMKPQPFLRPAIARVIYGKDVKKLIKQVATEKALGTLKESKKRVKFF